MSSTYTIGEAAQRSGFSATTLRYYEDIGLVEPTSRTAAGYRLYDDDAVERLAFIARAKQLGCRLEEIGDLVSMWDGAHCEPVQRRFHELLTVKITVAQRQIDDLNALVGQLHDAAAHLEGPATDGPCSGECACMTIHDRNAPIACTASREEIHVRIEQSEHMRSHLRRVERTEHGLLLAFPNEPDVGAEVATFTVDEKRCCAFWGFEVSTDDDRLTLRWDGPPDVREFFDDLVEFFEGDQRRTG